MAKPEFVIFDVDGLLLNTEFLWQKAWNEVGKKYDTPQFGEAFHKVVGVSGKDAERVLEQELKGVKSRDQMLSEAREEGQKLLEKEIALMTGVTELLDWLDKMHFRRAIATTTDRINTMKRLSQFGLMKRFMFAVCGDEVKNRKPDPEIYLKVLEKADVPAEKAIVLEDTGYGVLAANRAGIKVIMVPSVNSPTEKDRKLALAVVASLHDALRYMEKL